MGPKCCGDSCDLHNFTPMKLFVVPKKRNGNKRPGRFRARSHIPPVPPGVVVVSTSIGFGRKFR